MKNKYTHIEDKTIKVEFTTKPFYQESSLNIDLDAFGSVKKRKGWKTFDGMFKVFEELNDKYKKFGYIGDFTLRLPLRRYKRRK